MRRLTAEDYAVDAVTAAKALVGAWLCRRLDDGAVMRRRITETEAYCGEKAPRTYHILTPYNSFVRVMIGGQEQMGNILLGLGLMFVGVFVYCAVLVIVMQLFMVLFKALLSLWRKHNSVNEIPSERSSP